MQGKLVAALALVTGVIALSVGSPLLLRLTYMLVGALLLAGAITFSATRWLDISRTTRARRAEVGGIAEETIRVTNRGWLPKLWLEIRDGSDLPGHRAGRVLGALGPSRTASWSARTICSRRGQFHLGPLTLVGGDPLGLFEAKRELGTTLTFTVYPKTLDLRAVDLASGFLGGGQVVRRRADFTTSNVRSVRAYQPGDSLSRIHWPTTARRRALFTKEYELDPIADVWIVLDMEESVHVGRSELDALEDETPFPEPWLHPPDQQLPPTTEEYAVTAAASLARHFLDAGKAVGLVTHAQRRLVLSPDRGERQLHKILAALAVARATGRRPLADVLSIESHEFSRHARLCAITPATGLRWIESLRGLRYRGVRSLVALVEASTFGTAPSSLAVTSALAAHDIPARLIKLDDDIASALRSGSEPGSTSAPATTAGEDAVGVGAGLEG